MKQDSPSLRLSAARYTLITLVALLIAGVYRRVVHVNQTTVALTFLVLVLLGGVALALKGTARKLKNTSVPHR